MNNNIDWIYRSLDIGLAANNKGDAEVVVKDSESGLQANLVFDSQNTKEETIKEIGEEIYSWILIMFDQLDEDDD